ncbi:MAG: OmpA family protein [Bacteroidota bacterium]
MKKILFSLLVFSFVTTCLQAQPINRATPSTMRKTGDEAYEKGDYYNALDWYDQTYKEAPDTELALRMAELNYILRDYRRAESYFRRVLRRDKKGEYADKRFYLARAMKMNGKYEESIEEFVQFIEETKDAKLKAMAKNELTGAEFAIDMEPVNGVEVKHAGREINSYSTESSPMLSTDGQNVYYASISTKEIITLDEKAGDYHSKIYIASKDERKGWDDPQALDQVINRPGYHTGNPKFTRDGDLMYFTRTRLDLNEVVESKIYISPRSGSGWGAANEVAGVNGDFLAKHPAMGELYGEDVMFFVSDMDGGYGGDDIYYAKRKADDAFGDPINLGPTINSEGNEASPFYKDGILYFSSDGFPTAGGFDIFKSEWDGASWSRPENMGLGYNSSVDDLYFTIDAEGYKGFLVSNREGTRSLKSKTCCDDIFEVNIARIIADLNVFVYDGAAKLNRQRQAPPLNDVEIQLIEMTDNTMGANNTKNSGPESNTVNFALGLDLAFRVVASKEGYYPDTLEFNSVGLLESTTFTKEFTLQPLPPPPPEEQYETFTINEPIRLNRIYYDLDDDKILPASEPDLQIVLELMNEYNDMVIEMGSHTDSQGRFAYNERLSQRRADSAKAWLTERGIVADRIKTKGYGETQILNHCTNGVRCSDDEHRFNRRTVFTIIEGPTEIKIEKKRLKKTIN